MEPHYKPVVKKMNRKMIKLTYNSLTVGDVFKILVYLIMYLFNLHDKNINVQNWCVHYKVSDNLRKLLSNLSIAYANTPDKVKMEAFTRLSINLQKLCSVDQLSHQNEWLDTIYKKIINHKHYTFLFDTTVKRINTTSSKVLNIQTTSNAYSASDYLFCIPIRQLYSICSFSNEHVQRNWFSNIDDFGYFTKMSSYTGLGFQLHFTEQMKDNGLCWSCRNDWTIVIYDKSNYLQVPSKDLTIKSVWSCVIVDLDTKSGYLNKSVNECLTLEEIETELTRQLTIEYGSEVKPKKITRSDNMFRQNSEWMAWDSSYSNSMGILKPKGKLSNLYSIGPHNIPDITLIDTAIQSAVQFCDTHKIRRVF